MVRPEIDMPVPAITITCVSEPSSFESELNLEIDATPVVVRKEDLIFKTGGTATLSPAQLEFNKLMKRLENARARHAREQARLDSVLATCIGELMPLIDNLHRLNFELVIHGHAALRTMKLTARRREWFGDLLSGKAGDLLADSSGLTAEQIGMLEKIVGELGPCRSDQEAKEAEADEFDFLRGMLEAAAREAGVDLDLGDLDIHGDPAEFERKLHERMTAAAGSLEENPFSGKTRKRKPSKAQLERERKQREIDEAKQRDFKSLYKQLAKALHPDLETDPTLKHHKEDWMKRLTTAYAAGDLRELLRIEMEWLGEESSNLATAGDGKLEVYSMILKEQIAEIKQQTGSLVDQPQYFPLRRFMDDFTGFIHDPVVIKLGLLDEMERHQWMLQLLKQGDGETRKMIHEWADSHARASRQPKFPF
jgi:molecular chaperone GrpE (heat shock protein)